MKDVAEKLAQRCRELSIFATHVAGGGSEMFSRIGDEFYADAKACRERYDARMESVQRLIEARAQKKIDAQSERERVLVDALEALKSDAAHVVDFYHRNGPTWTGKDGHEYDDMSSVIGRAEETISAIEAALTKAQP